jgi:antitoxin VapB
VFPTTEQCTDVAGTRRDEVATKLARLRSWLAEQQLAGLVLLGSDAIAWLTGGLTCAIERGAPTAPLRVVLTPERCVALTTNVEQPRLAAEAELDSLGIELEAAPWYDELELRRRTLALAGASTSQLACDRDTSLGRACEEELIELRLALSRREREALAALGSDTASALEGALRAWRPGQRDFELQARVERELERRGAFAPCLIVGGDERVERYRHPLASGAVMERIVMAVAVAERGGLHVAATRFVSEGRLSEAQRRVHRDARSVEEEMLAACVPGATYGEVMLACARGYRDVGQPEAWREHYQGGPIAYRQREFELVPTQRSSRWFDTPLTLGHAVAWNPSLAGGGKVEDTYLLEQEGLRRLTDSGSWPLLGGRPAVLDRLTGEAA